MSQHQIQTPTLEVDGHLVVVSYVAGITKIMLTPEDDQHARDVFFDVLLTNSNVTLRVSRRADPEGENSVSEVLGATIEAVATWRTELASAVKNYRLNPV